MATITPGTDSEAVEAIVKWADYAVFSRRSTRSETWFMFAIMDGGYLQSVIRDSRFPGTLGFQILPAYETSEG